METVLQRQKLPRGGSGSELTPQAAVAAQQEQQRSGLTVAMVLLASVLAAVVSQAGLGSSPAFTVPEYRWVVPHGARISYWHMACASVVLCFCHVLLTQCPAGVHVLLHCHAIASCMSASLLALLS